MSVIYLDNSATTRVSESAAHAALETMREIWGNPSSVHSKGIAAEKRIEEARSRVIRALCGRESRLGRLLFTGSGTEADNLAILGYLSGRTFRTTGKPRVITTDSEHPAVENAFREAESRGLEIVRLSTAGGIISCSELKEALTPDTVFVSVMRVNNETGAVYDVSSLFRFVKEYRSEIVTHCDAVQAFCKINCDPIAMNADIVSLSGHKIGAPKGIGALWCRTELLLQHRIRPLIFGGGQEDGFRSGTENTPGIAAFGEAALERSEAAAEDREKVMRARESLLSHLPDGVKVNLPEKEYLPHIVSLQVPGIRSEVLVRFLSEKGIFISAGSACSSRRKKPSRVLSAFGLSDREADSTVRVSFSHENTPEDAVALADALSEAIGRLARIR